MPEYAFVDVKTGETFVQFFSYQQFDKLPQRRGVFRIGRRKARINFQASRTSTCPSNYPMESDAMGVNPSQIKDQKAADRRLGVPIDYNPHTGAAIYPDKKTRKKHCEAHGFFDRNGTYSDPQRS